MGHNAAVALATMRDDGKVAVKVEHLEEEGSILAETEDLIVDLCDRYAVTAALLPLDGFRRSTELLEARGVPVVEAPHRPQRLVEASATLDKLLTFEEPHARRGPDHASADARGAEEENEVGERYMAEDHARAVVAVAMAVHHASAPIDDLRMILPSEAV